MATERLNKVRALAAFSPDALSSIAYANQEIFLGLVVAGSAGLQLMLPVGLAITALLAVVALSYAQTLPAYPSGGGSYAVARENLGLRTGKVAGAALLIGYVLTAAVSLTAGVEALASAFPGLWPYRVGLALILLTAITLANLHGLRESGTLMSLPVYFFLVCFLGLLAFGWGRAWIEGPSTFAATAPVAAEGVTAFLVLHAFAAGCTALTGIEAISNGVPAFQPPEAENARKTLIAMALLMGLLFVGSLGLIQFHAVVAGPEDTILSALARRILGFGPLYLGVQAGTLLVLAVAANTSFAGFPRLASVLAADRLLPHQFSQLGDRLVYSNGMIVLAALTGALIVIFNGESHALIPLFAVGVFLAFSLSQTGMVVHWTRHREKGWRLKSIVNAAGALTTGGACTIIALSRLLEGAWIVLLLIPALVGVFSAVDRHYREVAAELTLRGLPPSLRAMPEPRVVIPISGVHRGVVEALRFARGISEHVTAIYVEIHPGEAERIRKEWEVWGQGIPLEVLASPFRSILGPILEFLDRTDHEHNDGQLASVILPEFVPARWWHHLLHNQTALLLRLAILYRRRRFGYSRAIIDIPFHLRK
jgi:amino acid transporter